MTDINLAERARDEELTVKEVNAATKEMLEEDKCIGYSVLYCATFNCPIEVVEAILDKNVNIDRLSGYVSIVVVTCYLVMVIKLTLTLLYLDCNWTNNLIG
jgi:hypothetical protein